MQSTFRRFVKIAIVAFFVYSLDRSTALGIGAASIGNGGVSITCHADPINSLSGEYALDFVLTGIDASDLAPVTSVRESLDRIGRLLFSNRYILPHLDFSFRVFAKDLFNTSDATKFNYWEAVDSLSETNDQRFLLNQIPRNCLKPDGTPNIRQGFIRFGSRFSRNETETTVYKYVPAILASLDQNDPVQQSILLTHEWLWHMSFNVQLNRRINRFLHSRAIETMTYNEVRREMERMGFNFARVGLMDQETITQHGSFGSHNGTGATIDEACLSPRREYARQKVWIYEQICSQNIPSSESMRLATAFYDEKTWQDRDGAYLCFVHWSYICAASAQ